MTFGNWRARLGVEVDRLLLPRRVENARLQVVRLDRLPLMASHREDARGP